jgi:hypothetical protein
VAGVVDVATAADSTMTVVSIDMAGRATPVDGLVDYAFRVQHDGQSFSYHGPGQVTFKKGRLVVAVDEVTGWIFSVPGVDARGAEAGPYAAYQALGVARFWGPGIHTTFEGVRAALTATCSATTLPRLGIVSPLGLEGCGSCEAGGGNATGCAISCGDIECSVDCPSGMYACCNCPASCRCCR